MTCRCWATLSLITCCHCSHFVCSLGQQGERVATVEHTYFEELPPVLGTLLQYFAQYNTMFHIIILTSFSRICPSISERARVDNVRHHCVLVILRSSGPHNYYLLHCPFFPKWQLSTPCDHQVGPPTAGWPSMKSTGNNTETILNVTHHSYISGKNTNSKRQRFRFWTSIMFLSAIKHDDGRGKCSIYLSNC